METNQITVTIDRHFGDKGEYLINPIILWYVYTSDRGTNPTGFVRAEDGKVFSYAVDFFTTSLTDEIWNGGRQVSNETAETADDALRIFTTYYEKAFVQSEKDGRAYDEWKSRKSEVS